MLKVGSHHILTSLQLVVRKTIPLTEASHRFFSGGGGKPRPLKGYHAPPQGVRGGGEGPRTVAKFHFLKRFKVFENEFIFQKCQHFSSPKDPFFLRKILENGIYFTRISEFFSKNYFKFSLFMITSKIREILCEFKYLNEKFMKKAHK